MLTYRIKHIITRGPVKEILVVYASVEITEHILPDDSITEQAEWTTLGERIYYIPSLTTEECLEQFLNNQLLLFGE